MGDFAMGRYLAQASRRHQRQLAGVEVHYEPRERRIPLRVRLVAWLERRDAVLMPTNARDRDW